MDGRMAINFEWSQKKDRSEWEREEEREQSSNLLFTLGTTQQKVACSFWPVTALIHTCDLNQRYLKLTRSWIQDARDDEIIWIALMNLNLPLTLFQRLASAQGILNDYALLYFNDKSNTKHTDKHWTIGERDALFARPRLVRNWAAIGKRKGEGGETERTLQTVS